MESAYTIIETASPELAGAPTTATFAATAGTHLLKALRATWEAWIDSAPYLAGWYWTGPWPTYGRPPR